jgi:hypothetical protein
MKFDELKDIWDNETLHNDSFKSRLETLSDYNSPMKKLKKTLKMEFILTWITIVFMIFMCIISDQEENNLSNWFFLNLVVTTTVYYHIIFYKFYKKNMIQGVNTYHNLIEFVTEFKYSLHIYRSYNYIIMLILAPIVFNVFSSLHPHLFNKYLISQHYILAITFYILFIVIVCELWINTFYSKSLQKLQTILNQIEVVEENS